jgi:hypothetical protein
VVFVSAARIAAVALLLVATLAGRAGAQRADSARAAVASAGVDTSTRPVIRPPLSPRRAFLYSLLLPGYAQSRLGRPTASAIFVTAEVIGIAMLRESNAALRQARRLRTDSLVTIGFEADGTPIRFRSPYSDELIDLRRGHREDWVAALVANHFFAGADAYVASHLWDLPSQVSVRQTERGTTIAARIRW